MHSKLTDDEVEQLADQARHDQLRIEVGEFLTLSDVQSLLRISHDSITQRVQDKTLLAVPIGGELLFPSFQFCGADVWPLLPKALSAMNGMAAWSIVDQLLTADPSFSGASLIGLIKAGDEKAVDRITRQVSGDGFA